MSQLHTNQLINETSPYLQQHAHNPVNWYPWGPEALKRAVDEDKIILVSIGYSACHWCHVMERESFEDEHVAALMNEHFINIKIDREERPDLDHIYMDAVQAMTGSGGWPLNVFLTPDTRPFYGGTYFPPVKAHGRASWTDVLTGVQQAWTSRRDEITAQAGNLTSHLVKASGFGLSKDLTDAEKLFTKEQCDIMFGHIMKQADTVWGGFGNAPKFPQTGIIQYLLQYHHFTGNKAALQQALLSLDKMLDGGIYDQVGGGLARYSTDTEWLAPHFEKMLYDNALLVSVLCDAYQVSGNKKYAAAIRHTLAFAQRELYDPQAGFYAAIDADSEGEEGLFYTWEMHEIEGLLGPDAPIFCAFYDVSAKGNWDGRNILRRLHDPAAFAMQYGMTETVLDEKLRASLDKLLEARNQRVRPGLDDKILLGWNALMITALCKAAASLGEKGYLELAKSTFNIILSNFRAAQNTHSFHHTFKAGIARYPAFLDDYAFLIQACIALQETSSETSFLAHAKQLTEQVIAGFSDEKEAGFFYTGIGQTDLLLRKKEVYDGATPSGNSIMAANLFYLSIVFDNPQWHRLASEYTAGLQAAVIRYPTSFPVWASLILQQAYGVDEIAVIGNGYADLRDEILRCFMPGKVLQCSALANAEWPLFSGKENGTETWIYKCRNYACRAPVKTLSELLIQAAETL